MDQILFKEYPVLASETIGYLYSVVKYHILN